MKTLKKKIEKDWGKKCKDFSPLCVVCLIWRAFETIELLYEEKIHITNWEKVNKRGR